MEKQQPQRLLYDTECKDCSHKPKCEYADTQQSCRSITDRIRIELRNNRIHRKIISKISISTEYNYDNYKITKTIADNGTFVLKEPYKFGTPFLRGEGIVGKYDGGTFPTKYYRWK